MKAIRDTQKKYCSLAITFAILAGTAFFLTGFKPVGKGLILGTLFSILNFVLMGERLPMKIGQSSKKIMMLSAGSIFFRYALMAIPIIAAIKMKQFNIAATICGLLMVQLIIMANGIIRLIYNNATQKNIA